MPSSTGLNSLFASSIRFNKFYNKNKQNSYDYQAVSPNSSSSNCVSPPSPGASLSHQRSFSRSSHIDIPQVIRRSLSIKRSSIGGGLDRSRPSSGTFLNPARSNTPPVPPSAANTQNKPGTSGGSRSTAMLEGSTGLQRSMSYGATALGAPAQIQTTGGPQSASAVYQQIVETSTKRISTLDYLRKS